MTCTYSITDIIIVITIMSTNLYYRRCWTWCPSAVKHSWHLLMTLSFTRKSSCCVMFFVQGLISLAFRRCNKTRLHSLTQATQLSVATRSYEGVSGMKYTTWSAHVTCRPSLMRDARYLPDCPHEAGWTSFRIYYFQKIYYYYYYCYCYYYRWNFLNKLI